MKKIKLMVIGDGVVPTGFSRVLHSIIQYFSEDEFDISWLAVNFHGDPHDYPYRIYPASTGGDLYGIKRLQNLLDIEGPDVVLILNDIWIIDNYLEVIKNIYKNKSRPKVVLYFPVDAEDHDPSWYKNLDVVDKAFVYTEFGRQVAEKACPNFKFEIIPHGVDDRTFFKIDGEIDTVRKTLFPDKHHIYNKDTFIFFNGNRNQPRKKIDITLRAFKEFSVGKPENVYIYLHMGVLDAHVNVLQMVYGLDLDARLIISSTRTGIQTVTDEHLNRIYNSCNVGLNTSVGEGWGLVNNEHAATGAPQIVPDHSALSDLYKDCGLLVTPIMRLTQDHITTTGKIVRPEDVAEKMELIYTDKKLYKELSEKGLKKFTSEEYSWENVATMFYNEITGLF